MIQEKLCEIHEGTEKVSQEIEVKWKEKGVKTTVFSLLFCIFMPEIQGSAYVSAATKNSI